MHDLPNDSRSALRCFKFSAAIALSNLVLALQAHAGCSIQTIDLPVQLVEGRAVATVGINGASVPLTVDSGSFYSLLTEAAAAQLKLPVSHLHGVRVDGITGGVDVAKTRVERLTLLKGEIPRVEFIVGGNEPGAGTMGLMGRNLLSFTDTEYDLAHGTIRFVFPNDECARANMAYWAGSAAVTEVGLESEPREGKWPALRARVGLNGTDFMAVLDTGSNSTLVARHAAQRAGVAEASMTPNGSFHGAGRGRARAWTAPFETVRIGDETIRNNRLMVGEFEMEDADLLLGLDFFLSHRIYVSKKQSKMFFTYNGGPVFALNKGEAARGTDFDSAATGQAVTADEWARRGAALASRGNFDGALVDLDRACELDPTSAPLFAQRGVIHRSLKRAADALADFDKALALDPALDDTRSQRAWLRHDTNDNDGANADLEALDKRLAPQSQTRLAMSTLYTRLQQPARALAQLNQWLPAHPREAGRESALNSRCWIRAGLGIELDEALVDCNDAVDDAPKNASYLDSRGWLQLRRGQADRALADFDRSLALDPRMAWSLYGRGVARARAGDAARSEADLAAARKLQANIDREVARAGLPAAPAAAQ